MEPIKTVTTAIDGDRATLPAGVRFLHVDAPDMQMRRSSTDEFVRLSFPLTSEQSVSQPYGEEVLSHEPGAIRMDRINQGAVPLLVNHDPKDMIGMIDGGRLVGKRFWVDAHLFNTARAKEVMAMIEGGLRNVSARYKLHTLRPDNSMRGTYTATDWEVFEGSIVSIPGDATVGIGRNDALVSDVRIDRTTIQPAATATKEGLRMEPNTQVTSAGVVNADGTPVVTQQRSGEPATQVASVQVVDRPVAISGVQLEQSRRAEIINLCKMNNLPDSYRDHYIGTGWSTYEIGSDILKVLEERGKTNPQPASKIGLTQSQIKQFSLRKAILACIDKDWSGAGFELECSKTVAEAMHKPSHPNKFYVPFEVLMRNVDMGGFDQRRMMAARGVYGQRDLTVATAGQGGYLVSTDNMGFIEILRNRSVVFSVGARRLSGLQGNVTVPRQSAAATGYWLANEATQITESQQTFVQMAMSPKTVGAYTEVSRLLLLQSAPAAEGIVTDDLAAVVALAADLGALNGSGSAGQPQGIIGTSGIGGVASGSIDYAKTLEFQTDVASSNVVPQAGAYVTTPAVAAILMQKSRFSNTDTPLWNGNIWNGQVVGFPGMSSNQMPSANLIFGDWQEMVIGEWGVLEVETNPYANFQAGIIGVRALYSMDVGVRRPFAWSLATGVTT